MQILATALFVLVGLVNLAPIVGVLSTDRLHALYGIPFEGPNLEILMRHRAFLLGIVGGLLLVAAFHPPLRGAAVAAGLASMVSFIALVLAVGSASPEIQRVMWIDVGATVLLIVGAVLRPGAST